MEVVLVLLGISAAVELLVYAPGIGRLHRVLAVLAAATTALICGAVVVVGGNVFAAVLALLGVYRVGNSLRIVEGRMHEGYLRRATLRTTLALLGLQAAVFGLWWGWQQWHQTGYAVWAAIAGLQLFVAMVLLFSTIRRYKHTGWPSAATEYADSDLPTVSVAIPARNETEDLQACLRSLIASDYPKLEILVLDDCSQERRTPEIIRGFAHDGVRFVQGEPPQDSWLPKNQAYEHLAREASGDYLLFCGVDVRFTPQSLRLLVATMLDKKKQMVSILPRRTDMAQGRMSVVQAMRYWWELVPPRRMFRRPPVLSSCWVIKSTVLAQAGGFAAVARAVVPEAHFAKAAQQSDAYSFMRSDTRLGIESVKSPSEQRANAIRTRYPQLHKRPENVVVATMGELLFLALPFALAVGGFWVPIGLTAHVLAIAATALLVLSYEVMAISTRINTRSFGLIALPIVVLVDIALLHYSMYKYEFSEVEWRGRNICIPAMHIVSHLKIG